MAKHLMSPSSLIDWLKTKDPTEKYEYLDNHICLHAQYFQHKGIELSVLGASFYIIQGMKRQYFTDQWKETAQGHPRTFGAALARAQAYVQEEL